MPNGVERSGIEQIVRVAEHLKVVHHVPGRIRLRFSMAAVKASRSMDLPGLLKTIPGVRKLRVNSAAMSIVVDYDPARLPFDLWQMLVDIPREPESTRIFLERLDTLLTRN